MNFLHVLSFMTMTVVQPYDCDRTCLLMRRILVRANVQENIYEYSLEHDVIVNVQENIAMNM